VERNSVQKRLRVIRRKEEELSFATPKRAAKLVSEITRLKAKVFD